MGQQSFPMVQQLQHQQHTAGVPGQPNQPRMSSLPGWQPPNTAPAHIPHNAPRLQPPLAQLPLNPVTPTSVSASGASVQSGPPPRVEFDDNNPFSESFQERERKERLREQQERQRIQLMQEVDRQRVLQQRLEMEQHGTIGSELSARPSLPQVPFFSSDLPCDFIQPPQPRQQSPQQQQQMGPILQQGSAPNFLLCSEQQPVGSSPFGPDPPPAPDGSPTFHSVKQSHGSVSGAGFSQYQVRPPFAPGLPGASPVAVTGSPCSQDTNMSHGSSCPGVSQSLIQLYSDIIPEEKGKKKRTRKKKKEDDAESVNTPSTPHSDITAPPTPVVSDSVSTPTVSTPSELSRHPGDAETEEPPGSSTPNAAENQASLEVKGQLSNSDLPQNKLPEQSSVKPETDKVKTDASGSIQEIRQEKTEADQCPDQAEPKMENLSGIKVEEDKASALPAPFLEGQAQPTSIPAAKGELGNELLKHLLKNKKSASLLNQKSNSSFPSEESTKESKFVEKQDPAESSMVSMVFFYYYYYHPDSQRGLNIYYTT